MPKLAMRTKRSVVKPEPTKVKAASSPDLDLGRFRAFLRSWKLCEKCDLHKSAHMRVTHRGTLPCDVLFIGEAPGEVEDTLGQPFLGPPGDCLEEIIKTVKEQTRWDFTYAMTNTVSCLPCDKTGAGRKIRAPRQRDEIKPCSPFVTRMIRFANPKFVVLVGKTAESAAKFYDLSIEKKVSLWPGKGLTRLTEIVAIEHPSSIIRKEKETEKQAAFKRAVLKLTKVLEIPF